MPQVIPGKPRIDQLIDTYIVNRNEAADNAVIPGDIQTATNYMMTTATGAYRAMTTEPGEAAAVTAPPVAQQRSAN